MAISATRSRQRGVGAQDCRRLDRLDLAQREPAVEVHRAEKTAQREQRQDAHVQRHARARPCTSVPDPQPSAICIVSPKTKAPTSRLTLGGPSAACSSGNLPAAASTAWRPAPAAAPGRPCRAGRGASISWRQPVVKPKRAPASAAPMPMPTAKSTACRRATNQINSPKKASSARASGSRCQRPGASAGAESDAPRAGFADAAGVN